MMNATASSRANGRTNERSRPCGYLYISQQPQVAGSFLESVSGNVIGFGRHGSQRIFLQDLIVVWAAAAKEPFSIPGIMQANDSAVICLES